MEIGKNIAIEFNDFSKNYTNDMIGYVPHYLQLISSFAKYLPDNFNPQVYPLKIVYHSPKTSLLLLPFHQLLLSNAPTLAYSHLP